MYYVWKRSDDYISVSNGHMPQGWKTSSGKEITFEQLKTFDNWGPDITDFIEEQREEI